MTSYRKMKDENKQACDLMLQYSDDTNARRCSIKEFEKCAKTFQSWRNEILNAFEYGITNGVTE